MTDYWDTSVEGADDTSITVGVVIILFFLPVIVLVFRKHSVLFELFLPERVVLFLLTLRRLDGGRFSV